MIGRDNSIATNKGILINYGRLTNEVTWLKQTCPYIIDATFRIGSEKGGILTIEPGTTICFTEDHGITVGSYLGSNMPGKLIADGSSEPITFTSAKSVENRSSGDWNGISFTNEAMPGSIINNCIIEYGGKGSSSGSMIYCHQTSEPTITNNVIRFSETNGIHIKNCFRSECLPTISGNVFTDIKLNDIYID